MSSMRRGGNGNTYVRIPCPPTDASTTQPMQSSILPSGSHDTPDKPGGDTKTTDTKPADTKTPVKDDKPQQADAPKAAQPEKAVTGKDGTPSKAAAEKQIPKGTKKLTGRKTRRLTKAPRQPNRKKRRKRKTKSKFTSNSFRPRAAAAGSTAAAMAAERACPPLALDNIRVDEIPHTATGKIQKMTLRQQFKDYGCRAVQAAE